MSEIEGLIVLGVLIGILVVVAKVAVTLIGKHSHKIWFGFGMIFLALGWMTSGEWLGGPFEEAGFYHIFWIVVFIIPSFVMRHLNKGTVVSERKESVMDSIKKIKFIPKLESKPAASEPSNGKKPKFCPSCGKSLREGLKFCTHCGEKV